VGSIDFEIKHLSGFLRPNGLSQLLTPEAHQMASQLVSNAFKRRDPISMVCIIE
jgi:hypothetical protein